MNEKKRRDITLGEMQDECRNRKDVCTECPFIKQCKHMMRGYPPCSIDLTDPPRFNEAQMALLKAFKGVGAERVRITVYGQGQRTFDLIDRFGNAMSFTAILGISGDATLDLAELLGKDNE